MRNDTAIEWGFVLAVFMLLFVINFVSYGVRNIIMSVLMMFFAAVCVIKLVCAVRFWLAVKNGHTACVTGTITAKFGHKGRNPESCTHAWARYSLNGKDTTGLMICSVWQRLQIGQTVEIIVPKSGLKVFAFSEKQVRNAVITYAVFSAVMTAALAVLLSVCLVMTMR